MVQDQLKNVKRIYPGARAFAALLEDGSVISWGDPENGRFADLSACVFLFDTRGALFMILHTRCQEYDWRCGRLLVSR